jgi:hypothetical protein
MIVRGIVDPNARAQNLCARDAQGRASLPDLGRSVAVNAFEVCLKPGMIVQRWQGFFARGFQSDGDSSESRRHLDEVADLIDVRDVMRLQFAMEPVELGSLMHVEIQCLEFDDKLRCFIGCYLRARFPPRIGPDAGFAVNLFDCCFRFGLPFEVEFVLTLLMFHQRRIEEAGREFHQTAASPERALVASNRLGEVTRPGAADNAARETAAEVLGQTRG